VTSTKLAQHGLDWLRSMITIRTFEDKVQELFVQGLVPGTTHLCQGQEASCVGAVSALGPKDILSITYRGHGQAIARGVSLRAAFAEVMGRQTGLSLGMSGSMHFTDLARGVLPGFGIVGAGLPVAVGAAMAARYHGSDAVSAAFFGDGATNIGTFHEALNMAAVWRAPVVFVCENNLYGEFSPLHHTTPLADLADRATAFAMPGYVVDGMDVLAVHDAMTTAVQRARAGDGPTLLEVKTYRYRGHSRTDPARYRPPEELKAWMMRDPIVRIEGQLQDEGLATAADVARLREEIQVNVDAEAAAAAADPFPTLADARASVFAS
jgi:TPP-dependent pyruvate/acetoin dehydrogenase alpha subunit